MCGSLTVTWWLGLAGKLSPSLYTHDTQNFNILSKVDKGGLGRRGGRGGRGRAWARGRGQEGGGDKKGDRNGDRDNPFIPGVPSEMTHILRF